MVMKGLQLIKKATTNLTKYSNLCNLNFQLQVVIFNYVKFVFFCLAAIILNTGLFLKKKFRMFSSLAFHPVVAYFVLYHVFLANVLT